MQVPHEEFQTISPVGPTTPYENINASPDAFGAKVGQSLENAGRVGESIADDAAKRALAIQGLQNEAAAKDADAQGLNQLNELLYNPETGYYNKHGKDAVTALPDVMAQAQKIQDTMAGSLPSPDAQRMFKDAFQRRLESVNTATASHALTQNQEWMKSSSVGRIEAMKNSVALNYSDDAYFNQQAATIASEVKDLQPLMGWSDEQVKSETVKQQSEALELRFKTWAQHDPEGAQAAFRKSFDKMTPEAQDSMSKSLQSAVAPGQADGIAKRVMNGGGVAHFDSLVGAVIGKESGGVAGLTSEKGAQGIMQIMPDTARQVAKELGIPFDLEKLKTDKVYNRALGEQYLKDMLVKYQGNQTLALAAYNAGPGKVDEWIGRFGNPNTGAISDTDFAAKIPFAETKDYVENINKRVPPPSGITPTQDAIKAHLGDWLKQADNLPDVPLLKDLVKGGITSVVNAVTASQKADEMVSRNTLLAAMNDGHITNTAQIPQSPELLAAWQKASPDVQAAISRAMSREKSEGTQEGFATFYKLYNQAHEDPAKFADVNLVDYYGQIPKAYLNTLVTLQGSIDKQALRTVSDATAMEIANNSLKVSGIDPHPKDNEKAKAEVLDEFKTKYRMAITDFQDQNKRKPTPLELDKLAKEQLATVEKPGRFWGTNQTLAFKEAIPDQEQKKISDSYYRKFGRFPSESEARRLYFAKLSQAPK